MNSIALPLGILDVGTPELILILFAILILFGGQRLPELAKGLGRSIREFKKASAGVEEEIKRAMEAEPETRTPPKPILPAAVETKPVAEVHPAASNVAPSPTPAGTVPAAGSLAPSEAEKIAQAPCPAPHSTSSEHVRDPDAPRG